MWWSNLSKGAKIAICLLGGAAVTTAVAVPTIIVINNNKKQSEEIEVESEDETTSKLIETIKLTKNSSGDLTGKVVSKTKGTEIVISEVKIGSSTLTVNKDYLFSSGTLTIYKKALTGKSGNIKVKVKEKTPEPIAPTVSIESSTLEIKKDSSQTEGYYSYIISLKDKKSINELPESITVEHNGVVLTQDKYTYNKSTGLFKFADSYLGEIIVKAEAIIFHKVTLNSSSLSIDVNKVCDGTNLEAKISIINPKESDILPKELSSVIINNVPIESSKYKYTMGSGKLVIDKSLINGDIIISAEVKDKSEFAFKVTFSCDSHCSVAVYETQDYTKDPIVKTQTYSVDKKGNLLKDGDGQVNFKIIVNDGYDIDYIFPKGVYKNLKRMENEGDYPKDVYRLTKISGDTEIKIVTCQRRPKDIKCNFDKANNSLTFSWDVRGSENITGNNIKITSDSKTIIDTTITDFTYTLTNVELNKKYSITISPKQTGKTIANRTFSKMMSNIGNDVKFPRIELNTANNKWPTINSTTTDWRIATLGYHEGDDPYVNSLVDIYNAKNEKVYTSSEEGDKSLAKIKTRGNGSALATGEKKPYKLKLTNAADVLDTFREDKKSGVDYSHKDWILFPYSNDMSELVGFTTERTFDFDYSHEFIYLTLYINNDYQGLYALAESNDIGRGEGESQSRYKINKDEGFIIENDIYFAKEEVSFASIISQGSAENTFTYPDMEDLGIKYVDKVTEIKKYFDNFETLLKNKNTEVFNYIDIDSFTKWLVFNDVIQQGDVGGANRYLVKYNKDSKLFMGSPWDYQYIMGAIPSFQREDIRNKTYFYFYYLKDMSEFKSLLAGVLNTYKNNVLKNVIDKVNVIGENESDFNNLIDYEKSRFNISRDTFAKTKENINNFFPARIKTLEEQYKS